MKKLFSVIILLGLGVSAYAQNLDTTTVTDQMNLSFRGNATGSNASGGSKLDGTENLSYSGADSSGGPIVYINAYAGASAGDAANFETPVATITTVTLQPDRNLLDVPATVANTRPGATGASTAAIVSDDGGQNTLLWGQTSNSNYYVQADVYCWANNLTTATYEAAMVAARAGRDNDPGDLSGAYSIDRGGSYCLSWDYNTSTVYALKFTTGTSSANVQSHSYAANVCTVYFSQQITPNAWHTFRVSCNNNKVTYSVDGAVVANITDSTSPYANGRAALGYRESGVVSASELTAHFDNVICGPTYPLAGVADWQFMQ